MVVNLQRTFSSEHVGFRGWIFVDFPDPLRIRGRKDNLRRMKAKSPPKFLLLKNNDLRIIIFVKIIKLQI